jgi:hypothetical protein
MTRPAGCACWAIGRGTRRGPRTHPPRMHRRTQRGHRRDSEYAYCGPKPPSPLNLIAPLLDAWWRGEFL